MKNNKQNATIIKSFLNNLFEYCKIYSSILDDVDQ